MVKGLRPKYDIYISGTLDYPKTEFIRSKWANPYSVRKYGRKKALELYEEYIRNTPELYNNLFELKDYVLGCWCKPKSCHGDILIKLLNELLND
ncbi:hypothetical protein LCGC14_1272990 [marine sediment metagenome]|uniref:DUF4326 domain-containing protein n=1 Tax=marine sediment metagenome TaxID=412755 RepID=A0A0F9KZD7_9ZZZZ